MGHVPYPARRYSRQRRTTRAPRQIVDTRAMPRWDPRARRSLRPRFIVARRPRFIVAALVAFALAVASAAIASGGAVPPGSARAAPVATPDPGATPDPVATPQPPTPEPTPDPIPTPDPRPIPGGNLTVGFTEPNPNLLWPAAAKRVPAPFDRWRDEIAAIRPSFYRLQLDWRSLQPDRDGPLVVDRAHHGCMRDRPPCAAYGGLREQLQALAARQAEGGWETVVAIANTPDWAAELPSGCERAGTEPRSRPPRADALPAYQRMVREVVALAEEVGAELRWWNAWNEPNHPFFMLPQRAVCDVASPSVSVGAYVRLNAALQEALDAAPGEQERILGDLAGTPGPSPHLTSVQEFIAALPADLLCGTRVWAQHAYLAPRDDARVAREALALRGCARAHDIWVTESGARNTAQDPAPRRRCRNMHRRMQEWYLDPQVTVAFQYTLREDDRFPYGLIATGLDAAYPALGLWQAWGGAARSAPDAPAPALADACREPSPAE
jgi:hypothetical protein